MQLDTTTYQRLLGDELRRLRKQRGWTRRDLNRRLQSDISLQTLATYELGTRQCSVVRIVETCLALDEVPHELLAPLHKRVIADSSVGRLRIRHHRPGRRLPFHPELGPLAAAYVLSYSRSSARSPHARPNPSPARSDDATPTPHYPRRRM